MYVDSHCHLSFPELNERLDAILADMRAADVGGALCICTSMEEFEAVHALAASHDNLWASVGVHPETEGMSPLGRPEGEYRSPQDEGCLMTEPDVDTLCAGGERP